MPALPDTPVVTFMVVVRNERRHIEKCLRSILGQTLDHNGYEVLVIDSMSSDGTREIVQRIIAEHPERSVRLLDNPGLILSCGWNVGIRESRGEYIVRLDAHAIAPDHFLERNLGVVSDHPEAGAVGGTVEIVGAGFWGGVIAGLLSSMIGAGGGTFQARAKAGPTDSVSSAMYKREVMLEVGGLDEKLIVNQDNVLHARMRSAGRTLYFDPSIRSIYCCRDSLGALWQQMFLRSQWLMLMFKHEKQHTFMLRYYVPMGFVLTIVALAGRGYLYRSAWWLLAGLLGTYALTGLATAAWKRMPLACIAGFPAAMFVLHFAYGLGAIVGVMRYPFHNAEMGQSHPLLNPATLEEAECQP